MTTDSLAGEPLLPGLRAPGNRVSRRAVTYWTVRAALSGAVAILAELAGAAAGGFTGTWRAVIIVTAVLAVLHIVVMPRWRYRVHRWEVTDTALYTRSGWFSVHWRIAPISRIQTIDSHRSVGERVFGLANVTATTASAAGHVRIHALDRALADRLLDQLAVATGQSPGDAT